MNLAAISIPKGMTYIGLGAFGGCYFKTDLFVNNSTLSDENNWGAVLWDEKTENGLCIKDNTVIKYVGTALSVEIPKMITAIGDGAFSECRNLTTVTIPEGVTSIGVQAFYGCSSLSSVNPHCSD